MRIDSMVYGNSPNRYAVPVGRLGTPKTALAARLRQWREAKMTQDDVGDLHGISQAAMSKYETGTATPRISMLLRLLVIFGKTLDEPGL